MTPIRLRLAATAVVAPLLVLASVAGVRAQDVEMLGRIHGVQPPEGYFEVRRADPDAFEFGRAWKARTGLDRVLGSVESSGVDGERQAASRAAAVTGLGRREGPVEGSFTFPVVLGLFADSTSEAPYPVEEIQREYFTGPNSRHRTITEYYDEVSRGRVTVRGETFEWRRSDLERDEVTGTSSGLGRDAEVGEFIVDLVTKLDSAGTDWARFDNDGPDGVPNSGDDDGFVDVLAVMHPTEGAECGNPESSTKVWSHRWQLRAALDDPGGEPYVTSTPAAGGGRIKIDDYVILPVLECDWADTPEPDLNQIGVFAHELGHGFGLPDLYGTGSRFLGGAGDWGLMATGSWGCNGANPAYPCHPGAWTKYVMGWVETDTIPAGAEPRRVTLEPVSEGGRIVRVETNDDSDEYFLIEYRARNDGFDRFLREEGLLVWQVDRPYLDGHWSANRVNADPDHPGVWLRQADGRNDLMRAGGGRGDGGDPFPGLENRRAFHAGTEPSTFTRDGSASGLTLTDISPGFSDIAFDLANRLHTVTLRTDGAEGDSTFFTVDGDRAPSAPHAFPSAPFQRHVVEAAAGDLIAEGVRRGFQGWEDGSDRVREFVTGRSDTVLVATYGGRELRVGVEMTSPSDTVTPGTIDLEPGTDDGWVPEGASVRVEAVARTGFDFVEWTGGFAGMSNPLMAEISEPVEAGARFDLTYSVASNPTRVSLTAATEQQVVLQVSNANEPVEWSVVEGTLPEGLELRSGGTILGIPLDDGTFSLRLRARDAIGLEGTLALRLEVERPPLGTRTLTGPFLLRDAGPTSQQQAYLDWIGNRNDSYDVGDFRAFLRRHPDTPVQGSATAPASSEPVVVPAVRLGGDAVSGTDGEGGGS